MELSGKKTFKKNSVLAHDNEGWAVSYSDLLMVLMSFFIVYFNINNEKSNKRDHLHSLILKLEKIGKLEHVVLPQVGTNKDKLRLRLNTNEEANRIPSSINLDTIAGNISNGFTKNGELNKIGKLEIDIDLPKDIYETGKFEINNQVQGELRKVLSLVKDDIDSIQLVIIGHTDKLPFHKNNKNIVNNNLILSSLRAAKAVEFLVGNGLPESKVFVQGLNDQPRNTRSLSVRLREI